MEAIAGAVSAIAGGAAGIAWAFAAIYIVGFGTIAVLCGISIVGEYDGFVGISESE